MKTMKKNEDRFLSCTIQAHKQTWNAIYLDYQLSVLRNLIKEDQKSAGRISGCGPCKGEDHPLQGIYDYLSEILEKCGYSSLEK